MKKVITVSGQPGSGTTTLSKELVDALDAAYINAGDVFRTMASEHEMSLSEFSKHVNETPEIDVAIDYTLREIIEDFKELPSEHRVSDKPSAAYDLDFGVDSSRQYLVIESRLAGWVAADAATMKIWCQAPAAVRAERISDSNRVETADELLERQSDESMRYQEWYGIDIEDLSIYDLVINTSRWSSSGVERLVEMGLKEHVPPVDEGTTPVDSPFSPEG